MMLPMNSKNIIDRLIELGYTARQVAKESGLSEVTISQLRSGARQGRQLDTHMALQEVLGKAEKQERSRQRKLARQSAKEAQ